jgi:hypothetical protein
MAGLVLGAVAGYASLEAIKRGLDFTVHSAAEAEVAMAKLGVALENAGYGGAAEGVDRWSTALLHAKGVDDELSKTLIAQALTMGDRRAGRRPRILAADMSVVMGSTQAAADALDAGARR